MVGIDSNRLREKKEMVITLWVERCLKEIPSAGSEASLALRNSVPIYIDHLSEALATNRKLDGKSVRAHDVESSRIGKLHGADRAGNTSYVLTELISEYHILREVIFQVLERDAPLDSVQRDIILDSIEQAVNDAAVEFSAVHAEIQQKFFDTLTHDLKTPLSTAKLGAQIVLRRSDRPDACVQAGSAILASLNRLEAMVHDLLDASRIRAGGQLSLQFQPCDLDRILREVVDEMIIHHGDRFVVESAAPMHLNCGGDGIRRALENLIGNAIKYGAPSRPITISLRPKGDGAELRVHNYGSFIPQEEIPRLFEHFVRSRSAQEGTKIGWGLGLTLVQGVADAHGGEVRVESSEAGGTSFILDIPESELSLQPVVSEINGARDREADEPGRVVEAI